MSSANRVVAFAKTDAIHKTIAAPPFRAPHRSESRRRLAEDGPAPYPSYSAYKRARPYPPPLEEYIG